MSKQAEHADDVDFAVAVAVAAADVAGETPLRLARRVSGILRVR